MKIYMMTDLEGVAGVMNTTNWIYQHSKYYEKAKEFLTLEVNAAIEGLLNAGADEIIVQDGHGEGAIDIELLDSRVKLQRGWSGDGGPYPFGMDESFDAYVSIGTHPKAGSEYGHICHTGNFDVIDFIINGISVGEFGQQVFLAGQYGIVPIFASGCRAFTKEAESLVPGIGTVAVKEGVTPGAGNECTTEEYEKRNWGAIHLHPKRSRELIREGAYEALKRFKENPDSFKPNVITAPFDKRIIFRGTDGNSSYEVVKYGFDELARLLNA